MQQSSPSKSLSEMQTSTVSVVADRISSTTEAWKRKLLDLTKRNRAINFKVNKVSTVTVVDELPAEVFKQLYLREKPMKFKAAPEPVADSNSPESNGLPNETHEPQGAKAPKVSVAQPDWLDDDDDVVQSQDYVPYDSNALDERHTDDCLQTSSTPDVLDRSLLRLDEQAYISIEEQGVNTLFLTLGMLYYRESLDSDTSLRAPLVLLPVELIRKSARSGYSVRASEDEPLVNPALVEYLRRDHGIKLPELPDSGNMPEDYDLQKFLEGASAEVSKKQGWVVKNDIFLALLSFQKFVMYKDLEANREPLQQHRLIRQLVTRGSKQEVQFRGLPAEIRELELDRHYPPEKTFQVVDADSSQLRAIAASSRHHDLVIEGPPGTGKSQTITNLIAQALSVGKSVLFVAEKMAALSVVHDRLVRAKLGEFCLELHSAKANKKAVLKELGAAMDASLQGITAPTHSTQRLPHVRTTLSEYASAVHLPYGTLNLTPFRAYGELGRVMKATRVKYSGPVDGMTRESLDQTLRDLKDLAIASTEVGLPKDHPWRDAGRLFYTGDDLESIREQAQEVTTKLEDVIARAYVVHEAFNLPPINTLEDIETAASIAEVLARSPGAPLAVLMNESWNTPPADARVLIDQLHELEKSNARFSQSFKSEALEQDHSEDIAYVEKKAQGVFAFLAILDGRHRAIKKRWIGYRKPNYGPSLIEQANEMKQVNRLRILKQTVLDSETKGRDLFGSLWEGEKSNCDLLEKYTRWVVEFRGVCVRHGLSGKALEVAAKGAPDTSSVQALRSSAAASRSALRNLNESVGWEESYFANAPLSLISSRTRSLVDHLHAAHKWAAFESARQEASKSLAGELLPLALSGEIPFKDLAPSFLRAFYLKWLTAVIQARPILQRFNTLTHEERVREFREMDEKVLLENRAGLVGLLRDRLQNAIQQPNIAEQMPYLRKELTRQRGLNSLRKTMRNAGLAIRAIKPCFMMSPLTVAQLLDGTAPEFDLVIFDEASQLPAEDAAGAIFRGKQLIVVGDPKQLPPTNFFSVASGTANTAVGSDGQPLVEDSESILEEFMGAGVPMSRLKWHYRSAHESLISFSNVQFYESDLYTFPSVETGNGTSGLQFEYLPDGVYEGKGLNAVEARRVADEVVRFAKEQSEKRQNGEDVQTLGVGTFNMRQQLAILDELELRRRNDPTIEPFFDRSLPEPFFVKNLENIQGDERDVIFISVTYAKANDGKLRYNFGPLNGENGWRRLNVLTTRARQRMKVFSSMKGSEINAAATTSRGANLLREFLNFAELGRLESVSASLASDTESPFEQDVLQELTNRGFKVVPQVGIAGYRIDLGVLDDTAPGRFLCGIECDGVAYHSSEAARDRDRLRQQVLEARGWTIHRVWSTDWFKDRGGQVDRLSKLIGETRDQVRQEIESAKLVRAKAVEEAKRRAEEEAESARREAAELAAGGNALTPYVRPTAAVYTVTSGAGRSGGQDILEVPLGQLVQAVVQVIETEGPIHETELFSRIGSIWETRVGIRIQTRILEACAKAEQKKLIGRREPFFWNSAGKCEVRSRAGIRIPAERIAPEEYLLAIQAILGMGHGFSRSQLVTETRTLLGYNRTGPALEEAIGAAIDGLMSQGKIGESSTGIRIRT